jgi:hypothetical protein
MFFAAEFWPNAEHAVGEIRRVLRLGGEHR